MKAKEAYRGNRKWKDKNLKQKKIKILNFKTPAKDFNKIMGG